jgi:hypothetical protein
MLNGKGMLNNVSRDEKIKASEIELAIVKYDTKKSRKDIGVYVSFGLAGSSAEDPISKAKFLTVSI